MLDALAGVAVPNIATKEGLEVDACRKRTASSGRVPVQKRPIQAIDPPHKWPDAAPRSTPSPTASGQLRHRLGIESYDTL